MSMGVAVKLGRYALGGYVIWWAVLVALYYGQPGLRAGTWGLIGLSGVSGIVAGVAINRPSRKLPWLLLAAALTSFTAGQVSFLVAQLIGTHLLFPSFAGVLYLLTYPLYTSGLLIFIWWRTPDRDRRSLIDAHPTMTELTKPVTRQPAQISRVRLTVLMLASLIAPVVLCIESFRFRGGDLSVIALFSALLSLLVLSRLSDMAASLGRALGRERTVRQAGASLVSAVTVEQAGAAVRSATDTLFGRGPRGDVLLAVRTDGAVRAVATASADPEPTSPLTDLAGTWLPLLTGFAPILAPVTSLPPYAAAIVPGYDWMLLCPLTLNDRPSGDPLIGVLAVFGEQRTLADLSATMEILAHQVALAVERIMLREEVIRRGNEAYFRTLVQNTSDVILIMDDDGKVRYATPLATSIFGDIAVEEVYLWDLVADGHRDELVGVLSRASAAGGFSSGYMDRRITRRDGVAVQVQVRCSDLRGDPTVAGLVLTLRDVTEQRQLEEQLKYQAFRDALTGLPNRLFFQDQISQQVAAARPDGATAGVLFVDLDDFKVVNDTMGHGVGDELLAATAVRLLGLIRECDTAARLGGDEFALLIINAPDSAAVEAVAERVVRAFAKPLVLASGIVLTTVTVGVATTEDGTDTDELLPHADLALYAAKAAGKRQWRRYQPVLSAGLVRRRELQAALEEAVARSAFTLAYQPIVTLISGELAGFEALVRWPHPQWGTMHPGQFIALAEETGQIVPLGSWVLTRAAADTARWRRDPRGDPRQGRAPDDGGVPRGLHVSVNVSARQFSAPGFVDSVRRILDASGLEPGTLMLELTESVLLRRDERVHADLAELKAIGVKLAIDDFGTGYSCLSYLRELPIDVLKLDKSFVDGIAVSEQRLALAEGIVQIARTLQLEVIAEGIETEVQRDLLTTMGCRFGQGYLLAMPMAAHQAETLVRVGSRLVPGLPRQVPEPRTTKQAQPTSR